MSAHRKQTHPKSRINGSKSGGKKRFLAIPIALILIAPFIIAGVVSASAMQFENHDSFCASCHTEPESAYFQREVASSPSDLASFHATKNIRCIDCHSGKGFPGREAALILGAKDLLAFVSKHYTQPAPLTQPISDIHCLKCHADLTTKRDFNNHFHVFLSQWQAQDPNAAGCVDCHESHITTGDVSIAFLNQGDARQVCNSCHAFAGR
jgi:predicted CXXCH cytochrome family protein